MQKAALSARPNQHALEVEREDPDWSVAVDCRGSCSVACLWRPFEVAS
jgi:hypothetical protein